MATPLREPLDISPIATTELPPSEPAINPHGIQEEPKADLFEEAVAQDEAEAPDLFTESPSITASVAPPANPITAQIAGLAQGQADGVPTEGINLVNFLREQVDASKKILETQGEEGLRYKAAAERALKKQINIRTSFPMLDPKLRQDVAARAAISTNENFEKQMATAMENQALDTIEDLAAAGDYTQARILMNRYTPGKMDSADVWREHNVKRMIFSQLATEFQQMDDQEGWFQMMWTGLASVFQPSSFSYLGNVDEGVGGYKERYWRFFSPGTETQRQAEALWNMSAEDLGKYREQLKGNMINNATSWGSLNPDKLVETIGMYSDPMSDEQISSMNTMSQIESASFVLPYVGFVPYRLAGRALSVPYMMASSGARKEAAAKVSDAFETLVKEGPEKAQTVHGMDEESIIDQMMPTAINPVRSGEGDEIMTSLSGQANYDSELVRQFTDEWKLVKTERFTSEEEISEAAQKITNRITERMKAPVLDFEVVTKPLADGTNVRTVRATVGKEDGSLHASLNEAVQYAQANGWDEVLSVEMPTGAALKRPQDLGYRTAIFHGTPDTFAHNKPSSSGKLGPGVYGSPDAKIASDYAESGLASNSIDASPNVRALLINEEKVFGWKQAEAGWTLDEMKAAMKELKVPAKAQKTFLDDAAKALETRSSAPGTKGTIDSQTFIKELQRIFDKAKDNDFLSIGAALNKKLEDLGYHGISANMWGDIEVAIFDPTNVQPFSARHWVQDVSGGYANIIEMNIPDTAFFTSPLSPPTQGFLAKFWKNASQTSDKDIFNKAVQADQKFNRLQKIIDKQLLTSFKALGKKERLWVTQVLIKGQNEARWFNDEEFSILIERSMGTPPTENMIAAYKAYRFNNDVEHMLRNAGVYREKVIRGFESIKFNALGDEFDIDGIIDYTPSVVPNERVYNLTDDVHYVGEKTLTSHRLQEQVSKGYIMFRTERPIKLKDGTEIRHFMAKRDDLAYRPLRQEQLAYSPGGHRLYTDKYFVKQGSRGTQPDTGQKFLRNANTFATGATIKEARAWANTMEEARLAILKGEDAAYLDRVIFTGRSGPEMPFPSGEEFVKMMDEGRIDKELPFEAVFNREQPTIYRESGEDVSRFVDEDDLKGSAGYHQQIGRMYYSSKGESLRSVNGGLAPTIDPFEAQSQALYNVARTSASFGDFKTTAVDRWVKTYSKLLNIRNLPEDMASSPMGIFNHAQPMDGIDLAMKQQMLGQRESIQRILGYESEFERGYRHWLRSTSEWIVGDSDSVLRNKIGKGVLWMQDKNPVGFLRGLAFDMKLGMFNIGQFFIQTSTMASALALNPRHGKFGVASAIPVWSYFLSKGSENVLEQLAKNGAHKLAGFSDTESFKAYVREAHRSGFFDLGDTHIMVNDQGPATTFGSLSGGATAARELGRMFFYNAEVLNRLVAHRIAYGEAVEKFGIDEIGSSFAREFIAGRAENYSFNMSGVSKASWQTGVLSVPTQFWAYNVRMIEALTGKNFTAAQKLRLAAMQMGMAGTGGLPIVAGVSEMLKNHYGVSPDIDSMLGTVDRGIADRLIYEMFDADVLVGEKWGTGSWSSDLIKDLFGMSEYNERPFASIAAGATGSILFQTSGPIFEIVKNWMTHESGAEAENLNAEQWEKLFKNISTVNNGLKAYMVYNYGIYQSTKGTVLADNIPSQDAMFIAAGFRPHELQETTVMTAYMKDRSESIKDAADQIKIWRQEAFTRPDLFQENASKVNAFVKLLPPDIKRDVLRRAQRETDPSLYSSIQERFEKVKRNEQLAEGLAE